MSMTMVYATDDRSGHAAAGAAMFKMFRRREYPDLVVAVPEDRAVPPFLSADRWDYGGRIAETTDSPGGFDPRAAGEASRLNGFYLFQSFERR